MLESFWIRVHHVQNASVSSILGTTFIPQCGTWGQEMEHS